MTPMLDCLMAQHKMIDELRSAQVDFGAQYVLTVGISEMLRLCVNNCNTAIYFVQKFISPSYH